MGSRVCDIKKKFEGLCEASQEPTCEVKSTPSRSHLKPRSTHLILPQKKSIEILNSNSREVGTKGNIKRSHAFRSDRNNRNPINSDIVESLNCIKASNIARASFKNNAGRPITNENQFYSPQDSIAVFSKKALPDASFECSSKSVLNNADSLQNICSNSNIDSHFESSIKRIQPQQLDMNAENTTTLSSEKPEYSSVSKRVHSNRTRPSLLDLKSKDKSPIHGPSIELLRGDGDKFVQTESNVSPNRQSKNVKSSMKEKNTNISEDNCVSNTLKKVLSSPLPSGPPPKKPPRTFAHTSEWKSTPNSPTSNKHSPTAKVSSSDDLVNLQVERVTGHKPIVKPVRSKTESQIMLKKLEIALSNHHQQGRFLESKSEGNNLVNNCFSKLSKPKSSFSSNKDKSKSNIKQKTADLKCSLPDSPNVDSNAFSSSGCFGVDLLSCSNSIDLMRSSHIYDVPFECQSHFYVKDFNEGFSGVSSLSSKDNICSNKVSSTQYGKIKSSDKFSEEHVYAKPHFKNQLKPLRSKPETNSVSQLVKLIDSNGKINSLVENKKELIKPPVLHYMVSITYHFVIFGLLSVLLRLLN